MSTAKKKSFRTKKVKIRQAEDPRWSKGVWENSLLKLAQKIGYQVVTDHVRQAMTHRSFVNEQRSLLKDNQRLEFLGDAIVGSAVTLALWSLEEEATEGKLSSTRARLINAQTLSICAESLGLDDVLRLGRGEPKMGLQARKARLADAFEALVGAMCLDLGQMVAQNWVWSQLEPYYDDLQNEQDLLNIKTKLQHLAHELNLSTPRYERIECQEIDLSHVKLWIGDHLIAESKLTGGRRAVEEDVAQKAYRYLIKHDQRSK